MLRGESEYNLNSVHAVRLHHALVSAEPCAK